MTQTNLSRRLIPLDSTFLYCEKPEQPMHHRRLHGLRGAHLSRDELARILLESACAGSLATAEGSLPAVRAPIHSAFRPMRERWAR